MTRLRITSLAVYVLLIFFVSSRPHLSAPGPEFANKDKVAHLVEYSILGVLLFWGIGFTVSRSKITTFVFLLAVGASIGALDEILQGYIAGRSTDIGDWLADAVGVALGVGLPVATAVGRRRLARGEEGRAP